MYKSALVVAALSVAAASQASLLWDYGQATGTYGGSWQNQTGAQNFADIAVFTGSVSVTGYNYYTDFNPANFSSTMHVKVLSDNGGKPGSLITSQDVSAGNFAVDGVNNGHTIYRVMLSLAAINLGAGTYWFGASGNGFEAAQISLNPGPGDNQMALFNGTTYQNMAGIGDQAYQLTGSAVPEPASLLAFGGLTLVAIRRRKKA